MTKSYEMIVEGLLLESSWQTIGTAALVATLSCSYLWEWNKRRHSPWPKVPGSLPLLGHFPYIGSIDHLVDKLEEWADTYGKDTGAYEIDFPGGESYVVCCREDRALEVLTQRPRKVYRPLQLREAVDSIGAKGVFAAEGETWRNEHKLMASALNKANLEDYLPSLKSAADKLIQKWKSSPDNSVSITTDLGGMTADSISKIMLNKDFDFLNHPESEMARNVQNAMRGALSRSFSPIWYWRIPVIGQYLDGYGWAIKNVWDTTIRAIHEIQHDGSPTDSTKSSKTTFLHKLFGSMREEQRSLDEDRVAGNAITLFLAGTDTTQKSLIMALYFLANDLELQKELREDAADFDWQAATFDQLYTQTPRIKSFLHEIHRWHAFPLMMLETQAKIPFHGYQLSKGQSVFVLLRHSSTQKNQPSKDVPMENSHEFNPRRYLEKDVTTGETVCVSPITGNGGFLSFGHGARSCPGRRYSELLSYCVLISILQNFDLELAPDQESVQIVYDAVMMSPKQDIQLKLTPRKT